MIAKQVKFIKQSPKYECKMHFNCKWAANFENSQNNRSDDVISQIRQHFALS